MLMETYPARKQYLAFPETKGCREYSQTFTRRIDGAEIRQMLEGFGISLIPMRIMGDQKRRMKRITTFWIKIQFCATGKFIAKLCIFTTFVGGG